MMRAASGDPALHAGGKVGHRAPHDAGHGEVRHVHDGLHALNILADQAETAAHVHQGNNDGAAGLALEDQAGRGLAVADAQGMHLNAGLIRRHRGADLQHVGAQAVLLALHQVVGVILHEGGAAVLTLGHGLHDRGHRGDLPVALAAIAVALRHQVLGGQAGQLLHAVEILEGVGEGQAALGVQHLLHRDLLAGLVAHGLDVVGGEGVQCLVLGHLRVDFRLGHLVHGVHQLAHGPGVDLPAELGLHLDLVALSHGHFAHVVAKAHDLHRLGDGHAHRRAHPGANAGLHVLILPVAGDDLARHAQTRGDEAVLAVAMGRLVQVHEVHVDLVVGDLAVVLGGEMQVGLLQVSKAVDPHLGRGEGVAPGDDASAVLGVIRLAHDVGDLLVGLGGHLVHQLAGEVAGGVHLVHHFLRAGGDGLQHLGAVQELGADNKPELVILQSHVKHSFICRVGNRLHPILILYHNCVLCK